MGHSWQQQQTEFFPYFYYKKYSICKKKYIAIYNLYHFYAMVNDIAWACSIINIQMKSHVLYSAVCSLTVLRNSACNIKNENVWNVLLQ